METAAITPIGEGAEQIDEAWLGDFAERYIAAWGSHDPQAVVSCAHPQVEWIDPALPEPALGRAAVAEFAGASFTAFPDLAFEEPGPPVVAADSRAAYVPWLMTGTNRGPIDPPGFAATGRAVSIKGFDIWQFREGLIWRYEAIYDFNSMATQLGLAPPRGGFAERAMVAAQRLRARLPG